MAVRSFGRWSQLVGMSLIGLLTGVFLISPSAPAHALSGADFDPELIIADDLFYDRAAMTEAQIQSFLDQKIGKCNNSSCLNIARFDLPNFPRRVAASTGNLVCEPVTGGNLTAAQIIYRVQTACNISAKVILVTLQKEQSLVTSKAPNPVQLRSAMGMGCPDTAPCQSQYYGFAQQVYQGAAQLQIYRQARAGMFRGPGKHAIQYHPNASCGAREINIRNHATAALYNYTPYQPNAAALNNLYGTGDSCSAYGNRNFWRFYNDWFGPTNLVSTYQQDTGSHVFARDAAGDLWVYPANGKTAWFPRYRAGSGFDKYTQVIGAGDINRDGHREILALDPSGQLWVYHSLGMGGYSAPELHSSGWDPNHKILAIGDFNSDGTQDLLRIDDAGNLWLHANNGTGQFREPRQVGATWQRFNLAFSPGDFNGDGTPDLIARDSSGNLWLYGNNGAGGWHSGRLVGTGWNWMQDIFSIGDFNADGKIDILGRRDDGRLFFYPGNGRGQVTRTQQVGHGWQNMTALFGPGEVAGRKFVPQPGIGDFDGDGLRDIFARDREGVLRLYAGNGTGGFAAKERTVIGSDWSGYKWMVIAGDFDGAGETDLITVDFEGLMWLHPGQSDRTFGEPVQIGSGWHLVTAVLAVGDFDGDGNPDLIARSAPGELLLYRSNGAGRIIETRSLGAGWQDYQAIVAAGDFNQDGNQDVLAIAANGDLVLFPGDGKGGFLPQRTIGWNWSNMDWIYTPGDFNRDGHLDIIARDKQGLLYLYPSDGKGGWKGSTVIGSGWSNMDWLG